MSKIRENRKRMNLSQVELARAVGMSQTIISQWEARQRVPRPTELFKLADLFGVSVESILSDYVNGDDHDSGS